eukprot:SAG22_NODE_18108_length_293_cov_0.798969_1_plen_79_part_10
MRGWFESPYGCDRAGRVPVKKKGFRKKKGSPTELTGLTVLGLDDNQIADVAPLAQLTGLTVLDLHCNQIADVAPLACAL